MWRMQMAAVVMKVDGLLQEIMPFYEAINKGVDQYDARPGGGMAWGLGGGVSR